MGKSFPDLSLEEVAIAYVDLGGYLERHSAGNGDVDRSIKSFLRRNASEKSKVLALGVARLKKISSDTVVHVRHPSNIGQRLALRMRDRDHRHVLIEIVKRSEIRNIQPPV